jgi:hypothetical protein
MIKRYGLDFYEYQDAIDGKMPINEYYFLYININDKRCPKEEKFKYDGIVELRDKMQIFFGGWDIPNTWEKSYYQNYKYKYYLYGPIKSPDIDFNK